MECAHVRLCLAKFVADTRISQFGHAVYFILYVLAVDSRGMFCGMLLD